MTNSARPDRKPKKSVALSGVAAASTAICTVGRSGNDLHYRGYDVLEFAHTAEFEEIAHLLIHEELPTKSQLAEYKAKLKSYRVCRNRSERLSKPSRQRLIRWMCCGRAAPWRDTVVRRMMTILLQRPATVSTA